jgi:hypothetical protein
LIKKRSFEFHPSKKEDSSMLQWEKKISKKSTNISEADDFSAESLKLS